MSNAIAQPHPFELALPLNSRLTVERITKAGEYALPTAPFRNGFLPVDYIRGQVQRQIWRVEQTGVPTASILAALQDQLRAAGFQQRLECETLACGGFDFRFATEVFPAPDMHVDLGDFRFLSATRKHSLGLEGIGVLVSKAGERGLVQIIRVTPAILRPIQVEEPGRGIVRPQADRPPAGAQAVVAAFAETLQTEGHVALSDLQFASGSTQLGAGQFASISALAKVLKQDAALRVVLVGHTDTKGAMDRNIELSKARANAVRDRLIGTHGVSAQQVDAHGVGPLSPLASNQTVAGRKVNRRVEAVLVP